MGNKEEIGEEEGKREDDYLLTAASAFLERQSRPLVTIAIRESFRSDLLHGRHGLPATGTGSRDSIHLRRNREVVAGDDERRQYRGQRHHAPQWHHGSVPAPDVEFQNILAMRAEIGIGLKIDLKHTAIQREIIDIARAEIRTDRGVNIRHTKAKGFRAGTIHIDIDLRHIRVERGCRTTDFRPPIEVTEQSAGHLRYFLRRLALQGLQTEIKTANSTDARNCRRCKYRDICARHLRKLGTQGVDDVVELQRLCLTIFPWCKGGNRHGAVGRAGRLQDAESGNRYDILYAFGLAQDLAHVLDNQVCTIERGRAWQLYIDKERALIFVGQESRGKIDEDEISQRETGDDAGNRHYPVFHQKGDDLAVAFAGFLHET